MREFVAFEDVEVVKRSDRALLCRVERKEVWVPQSHIALTDDAPIRRAGDCGLLVIPRRLAVDLGLVDVVACDRSATAASRQRPLQLGDVVRRLLAAPRRPDP